MSRGAALSGATELIADLRQVFATGRTRELSWRLEQLRGIERLCDEREAEIVAAGRWGFEVMSHRRAVLAKRARPDLKAMYPPYTERDVKIMRKAF